MFLANENFPKPSIDQLRKSGFAVRSIAEDFQGISDIEVIKLAIADKLIILTFDKDYGELIFKHSLVKPPSVIFFREKGQDPHFAGEVLLLLMKNESIKLADSFIVIESNSVRQRFY